TTALTCSTTPASQATAAQVQSALQTLTSVSNGPTNGYCLVTGPTGAGTTASPYVYTVYFSNPTLPATALTGQELNSSGAPTGSVTITYQPSNSSAPNTWQRTMSVASLEGQAHGVTAGINAATARTEVVVPFPIEIFNSREGVYN